ncbi:hypothetical protein PENTCL1PPCAC_13388, partial [Pristionchus entomophagus]
LEVIEEWKRQTCEFAIQSDDNLVSLISKSLDAMTTIHNTSTDRNIRRTLDALDIERSLFLRSEKTKEPSIRSLMYGIIESLHLTLLHLTSERNHSKYSEEILKPANEIPVSTPLPLEPKEEPIDQFDAIPYGVQVKLSSNH